MNYELVHLNTKAKPWFRTPWHGILYMLKFQSLTHVGDSTHCVIYGMLIKKQNKKCNNAITLGCTYIEPREFLACANMDRELGCIRVTNKRG